MDTARYPAAEYADRLRQKLGPRLKRVILFGSRARGDASADSDYYCLVVVTERTPEVREAVLDADTEMLDEHDELFAALIYTEPEWKRSQSFPLGWNIQKEGIAL